MNERVAQTVPLSRVLDQADLELELVVGEGQRDRPVRWAHTSELRDPVPYLRGQELLLTAGVDLPRSPAEYVESIARAGVSALGFGVEPVHRRVPAALRAACERVGLPLIKVPVQTPFLAVCQAVGAALEMERTEELRRLVLAQRAMARAAQRWQDPDRILRAAHKALGHWVALVPDAHVKMLAYGTFPLTESLLRKEIRLSADRGEVRTVSDGAARWHLLAQVVDDAVFAVGSRTPLDVTDRAIAAAAASLLTVVRSRYSANQPVSAALTRSLLAGDASELHEAVLPGEALTVLAGRRRARRGAATQAQLAALLDTDLVSVTGDRLLAIAGTAPTVETLASIDRSGWTVGAANPCAATELGTGPAESVLVKAIAAGRSATQDSGTGLDALIDTHAARDFARRALRPVPVGLLDTLRIWLAHNGNVDATAHELGVHGNSVRYRLGKIATALDADLADTETRMELWFALRHHPR
jgi:hypothetical protein